MTHSKLVSITVLATLCLHAACKRQDAPSPTSAVPLVGQIIQGLQGRTDGLMRKAASEHNLLLEKKAREAKLCLTTLNVVIGQDERNRKYSDASTSSRDLAATLHDVIAALEESPAQESNTDGTSSLDIHYLIDQLPFKADDYYVRRIDGYIQDYREEGTYRFEISGGSVGEGYTCRVRIDGKPVDNVKIGPMQNAKFEVPVARLNPSFSESEAARRVPFEIELFKDGNADSVFRLDERIVLVPAAQ